jgi:hypothetical protein
MHGKKAPNFKYNLLTDIAPVNRQMEYSLPHLSVINIMLNK